MPQSSRIPALLQPYVRLPATESILLLTNTLDATANWLVIRFLCDTLNTDDGGEEQGYNVVLVSWMREYEFWRQEARKGGGLDLDRFRKERRFAFVDGLSGLFLGDAGLNKPQQVGGNTPTASPPRTSQTLPARGPLGRITPTEGLPTVHSTLRTAPQPSNAEEPGLFTLCAPDLAHIKTTITNASTSLNSSRPQRKTLLIFSNLDLILATNPSFTPTSLASLIMTLHNTPSVSHILVQIQSDTPLLSLSTLPQPLEINHHNFLVKCAHMSRRILGVRVLDTGVARDVSGVVRITSSGGGYGRGLEFDSEDEDDGAMGENGKGKEFLYQVKGDGSVRVFERGAGE